MYPLKILICGAACRTPAIARRRTPGRLQSRGVPRRYPGRRSSGSRRPAPRRPPARSRNDGLTSAREAHVGDMTVRRLLPLRHRRSVGAWCFADHYGPMSVDGVAGMRVPPHPHIGLQTVTWLISGNVLHRDSLGSEQMIRPGQLNLMTAGRGIAHSEESPAEHDPELHGVQLWVALPDAQRQVEPAFEHHAQLPSSASADSKSPSSSARCRAPRRRPQCSRRSSARSSSPAGMPPGEARPDGSRSRRRMSTCCSPPQGRLRWREPRFAPGSCSTWAPAGSRWR